MTAPGLTRRELLSLAARAGCVGVEFRNDIDLPGKPSEKPADIARLATKMQLRVLAVAEVKAFTRFSDRVLKDTTGLIELAREIGGESIVFIPANDGSGQTGTDLLVVALRECAPLLRDAGLLGMVEPLGFVSSTLRTKRRLVDAIEAAGCDDCFRLVHDTFHHHIAGETCFFPDLTGVVHISGVVAAGMDKSDMQDEHRIEVNQDDRLGSLGQLKTLMDRGYSGPVSYELFAPNIHQHEHDDLSALLARSMEYVRNSLST